MREDQKRNPLIELSDFLKAESNKQVEIFGNIDGLTEYQLPDGNIAYAGVLWVASDKIPFRGGPGIADAEMTIEKRVIRSTSILSVLRYSEKKGLGIYLQGFTGPRDIPGQDPLLVTGAYINPPQENQNS